jgi:hypothetical protein
MRGREVVEAFLADTGECWLFNDQRGWVQVEGEQAKERLQRTLKFHDDRPNAGEHALLIYYDRPLAPPTVRSSVVGPPVPRRPAGGRSKRAFMW